MAKVNAAASLIIQGKVPDLGWRRGLIPFGKNGLPKPGFLIINGAEVRAEQMQFQIRTYENRQAKYVTVGSNYREAAALLERMQDTRQREALDERLGIAVPKSAKELAAEAAEREASRKTLQQWVEDYLATKVGLSRHSSTLYKCIPAFAAHSGKRFLEDVTGQDVTNWVNSLKAADYAPRTCQTRYSTLRGFLSACGVNLKTLIDSASHKRLNKKPDQNVEPYTQEQLDALFAVCDPYHRNAFLLLLCTGLREREATHLTWRQIKWRENKIVVEGEMTIHHPRRRRVVIHFKTKTGKGREVPMFAGLKSALEEWRNLHPDGIFVLATKYDLPNGHLLRSLKRLATKAGLDCRMCAGCATGNGCEEFYLHKFRHTYAHRTLEKFSIHQVSKWMGHSNIAVTAIYLSGTPKDPDIDPFE